MFSGVLMVTLAAASWGTWSLFLRPSGLPATVSAPIMFAVMALVTLPLARREPRASWTRDRRWLLAGNTLFDAATVMTFFAAMRYTTVAIAVLTHYLAPILIALAAPRLDGTATRGARPAALVALAGLTVMLEPWRHIDGNVVIGASLGLVSAFSYAGNVFVVRRLAAEVGAARALCWHAALACVLMLPFSVSDLATVTPGSLGLLVAGGATLGGVSGVLFNRGLVRIGASRASVLTFAEPVVAVGVGIGVWHEPFHTATVVGGALVIAAGIHVARQAR